MSDNHPELQTIRDAVDKVMSLDDTELQTLFNKYEQERSCLNERWEEYSAFTLPHVYRTDDYSTNAELGTDYQALGAQATNHLANKLISTLFAPGRSFFRMDLTPEMYEEFAAEGFNKVQAQELLAITEKQAMRHAEVISLRTSNLAAAKSLIITGNSLIYTPDKGKKCQTFSLKDYVVKRDLSGDHHTIILRDTHLVDTLPDDLKELCLKEKEIDSGTEVELYTGIFRIGEDKYVVKQEINDLFILPRKKGVYSKDTLPWLPATWNLARGDDYGTGLVEEYAGAFRTLSTLSEAVRNLSAIVSDIKGLVNPMGNTDLAGLNDSLPGTWVSGTPDDVAYLNLDKIADLNFLESQIQMYTKQIGGAFLLNSATVRNAERVTAEEIRLHARELEESLGGVYSRLAEDLQKPLAKRLLSSMNDALKGIEPTILTGVDALGRSTELEQFQLFLQDLAMLESIPEDIRGQLKMSNVITKLASSRQIDKNDYLLPESEAKSNQAANIQQKGLEAQAEAEGKARGSGEI